MSLAVLGTAANVFGVMTPAKDIFEIFKYIVDSLEEVITRLHFFHLDVTDLCIGKTEQGLDILLGHESEEIH